jgi:F-type H+/Na+-transporting ATPase subunit alpha
MALQYKQYGTVVSIRGCIVYVSGLDNCINGQLIKFDYGTEGIIIGFDEHESQVLIVKEKSVLSTGDKAVATLEPFNTPVGKNFIGRIVNPLCEPLDNLGPIEPEEYAPIFAESPSVLDRGVVNNTLETGIKILDTMIPIGKGQRQLVLGDKMTGKTTMVTDIILNQKGKDIICIYCCIGKSKTSIDKVVQLFKQHNAFKYSIIVAAIAGTSPGQQYLVPYVGCSLGEYFMRNGGHAVVAFDDFTKHAWAYRELSLLLNRPPGRESYPGDVFYLHSSMIERAAQLAEEKGGGSMTFFPIVETLEGDLTGYIQTNLVSMTDGQVYFSAPLFGEGFKPAVDIGLSVSRIGNKAQWPILRQLSKALRLQYLQYRELLMISRLKAGGTQSDESADEMKGGDILGQLLLQSQDAPLDTAEEVILFFGLARKHLYSLDKQQIEVLKKDIYTFAKKRYSELISDINNKKELTQEIESGLNMLYAEYIKVLENTYHSEAIPDETEAEVSGAPESALNNDAL